MTLSDSGFTLIETLVALTVLAVGSVTLLIGVERHVAGVQSLSDRVMARWVAENALSAAALGIDMQPQWSSALELEFRVESGARALSASGLQAVTVQVFDAAPDAKGSIVSLTGYIATRGGSQ